MINQVKNNQTNYTNLTADAVSNNNAYYNNLANAIRFLAIDAVQKANSGHPGMPMGMADVATILFTEFLKFNPQDPRWSNRDRFVLSAGHGSMLLYALLYLTGYPDISIDDIKNFRQLHSKCAGHPEYRELLGIETTTGPLGQGLANAVGMAISQKLLEARFSNDLFNHKTYVIAGDGCLMEGISQEAISLAGHLQLKNLIVIWDNNSISIDGDTSITTSENIKLRFEACGFEVIKIDGHDYVQIRQALSQAQTSDKPVLIDCKTVIGFGSPSKAGSEKCHGSPLGNDEVTKTRQQLNWPFAEFEIPQDVLNTWRNCSLRNLKDYDNWQEKLRKLENVKLQELLAITNKTFLQNDNWQILQNKINEFSQKIALEKPTQASRKSSQICLEFLTANISSLIAGSADLTESVLTKTKSTIPIHAHDFSGRYIHYGVREHAMSAIMNGIALHSNLIPYAGTFLVFSDYLKPAIRLSALMQLQVFYIFTHDSIGLGEDGPTHQPIEHLAMLRAIPNLFVFRPCDAQETLACYVLALKQNKSPSALIFSRQNLNFIAKDNFQPELGGYVIKKEQTNSALHCTIIATGSELQIAIDAQNKLTQHNINARVVSMPCCEIFNNQSTQYQNEVLGDDNVLKIAIEASVKQGWEQFIGSKGIFIGMNSFGASAKAEDLYQHFKITSDDVVEKILKKIK
jgi:transketolase